MKPTFYIKRAVLLSNTNINVNLIIELQKTNTETRMKYIKLTFST